jgi:hypothetical protein
MILTREQFAAALPSVNVDTWLGPVNDTWPSSTSTGWRKKSPLGAAGVESTLPVHAPRGVEARTGSILAPLGGPRQRA